MRTFIFTSLALLTSATIATAGDSEGLIAKVGELTRGALVLVECKYAGDVGETTLAGMGVCYDADKGDFFTLALGPRFRSERIKELRIILPGFGREAIVAEFLGARPEVGIAFLRAKAKHNWRAIRFAQSSQLKTGQMVVSGGLMPGARANNPYFGVGYISTLLRIPERLHYVTGGRLTCTGSPVFAGGEQAIGIVYKTIYMDYQMPTARGPSMVSLKGRQESAFFMPVEEFAFALQNVPEGGQIPRPGSLGFMKALGVSESQAELLGLAGPAVTIDQVIPGGPAYDAGLRNGNVIVAVDGQAVEVLSSPEFTGMNLIKRIMLKSPGQPITVTVRRQGIDSDVSMKVAKMPFLPEEAPGYTNEKLGFAVREKVALDLYLDQSDTGKTPGLVVTAVAKGSPAESGGLKSLDVVTAVNGEKVRSADVFRKLMDAALGAEPAKPIMLMVHRSGVEPRVITIRP